MAGRGRNDAAIAAALQVVAQAIGQPPIVGAGVAVDYGVHKLETFLRNHPPTFKGRYDPDGAQKCPLSMFGRDFEVDLVCLPLEGMDVILGMNWLEYNHVHINCFS